jgi:hypothetical protein
MAEVVRSAIGPKYMLGLYLHAFEKWKSLFT